MPAIELQRLNKEITQILSQFDQVDRLHGSLVSLLEKYANWSFRPGQTMYRNVQLPSYYTPALVMQRLVQAIKPKCQADPGLSMQLIERLRTGKYLEQRTLAIHIFALLPAAGAADTLPFLIEWANSEKEASLLEELLATGCAGLRANTPQGWLAAIEQWLESADPAKQVVGLRAMIVSVQDPAFDYLPSLFQLAGGPLTQVPHGTAALLDDLLGHMIRRSPAETSFFLRQILLRKPSNQTTRLIRKKLGSIPVEFQPVLRSLLFHPDQTAGLDPDGDLEGR